jgi:hypothetical protein
MPYHLEKGPWLSVFEDYLNGDRDRTYAYLVALRESRTSSLSGMSVSLTHQPALNADPDNQTVEARQAHLNRDWYGMERLDGDGWLTQQQAGGFVQLTLNQLPQQVRTRLEAAAPPVDGERAEVERFGAEVAKALEDHSYGPSDDIFHSWPTTGFWFQYFGDVQAILRETLIRAIEVSLGLAHVAPGDEPCGEKPDRHLPIELFWKCPQRWFEGWVCWRSDRHTGTGQVTVMLATPGHGKPVLESPLAGKGFVENPPDSTWDPAEGEREPPSNGVFSDNGGPRQAPKGMWVITHADHAQLPATPDEGPTTSGRWSIPSFGPTYVGVGPIVTVAPSEIDGGVRPNGRSLDVDDEKPSKSPRTLTHEKKD